MAIKWEYRLERLKPSKEEATESQLNKLGQEGWEAWDIYINNWDGHLVRLKRIIEN